MQTRQSNVSFKATLAVEDHRYDTTSLDSGPSKASPFGNKYCFSFGCAARNQDSVPVSKQEPGYMFGAPASTTTHKSSVVFSFGEPTASKKTSLYSFVPSTKLDGSSTIKIHSITGLQQYEESTFEELRLNDYQAGNNGCQEKLPIWKPTHGSFSTSHPLEPSRNHGLFASTATNASGLFGAPAPSKAAPFGRLATTSSSGGSSVFSFGGSDVSSNNSLFGSSKASTRATAFSFTAPTQGSASSKPADVFSSSVLAKPFQFRGGSVAAEEEKKKAEDPPTETSGEIQALKDRLRTAKLFEKFAKTTFLKACEQSGATNDQQSLDMEKAAKSGFLEACKESEAAEASLEAALLKCGISDTDEEKFGDERKRSVSPVEEIDDRVFKRPKF